MSLKTTPQIGALRQVLAYKLRAARHDANKTMGDLIEAGVGSLAKIKRIENGKVVPKPGDVMLIGSTCKLPPDQISALVEMAKQAKSKTWWEVLGKGLPADENFWVYLHLESFAVEVDIFGPYIVPGLAQTDDYSRAQLATMPNADNMTIERALKVRQTRQEETIGRARLDIVIGEEALHRQVGSAAVMQAQIAYLRELDEHPDVSIRYVPFSAGAHQGGRGEVTILRFNPAHKEAPVVYTEPYTGGDFSSLERVLRDVTSRLRSLQRLSVPIKEFQP